MSSGPKLWNHEIPWNHEFLDISETHLGASGKLPGNSSWSVMMSECLLGRFWNILQPFIFSRKHGGFENYTCSWLSPSITFIIKTLLIHCYIGRLLDFMWLGTHAGCNDGLKSPKCTWNLEVCQGGFGQSGAPRRAGGECFAPFFNKMKCSRGRNIALLGTWEALRVSAEPWTLRWSFGSV